MLCHRILCVLAMLAATPLGRAQSQPAPGRSPGLPKVVLIGDSIRLGYAPYVAQRLAGRALVVSPPANGGDSGNVLQNLDAWVVHEQPSVVHINCGLHDLKIPKGTRRHQVDLAQYEANLKQIVASIHQASTAALVFANTTPVLDDRHARRGAGFDRFEADVRRYNAVAEAVMRSEGITVNDLHWVVEQGGPEQLLTSDGTHYTPAGCERLGEAVADCVLRQLAVLNYRPLPAPASGPQARDAYRKAEAERDALVPPAYKRLPVGTFRAPENVAAWERQRPQVLNTVLQSLGDLPPRPRPQKVRQVCRELRRSYVLEKIAIANGVDGEISTLLLIPEQRQQPTPAILWLHSSTPDKTQILTPHTNGGSEPLGEVLVRAGYVVLAPDAYWHGDRASTGPAGPAEIGRGEQESLFKLNLWLGRTLWGMFVRDDQIALDYLCSRPEVDQARIGATGMSMGSTRAWWLAAVDERVAATVGVACLTRYQNLIAHGQLHQHGVYYFVHGLLRHFDSEGVLALLAPRPFLALTGELDAGSPADGVREIEDKVGGFYRVLGVTERFRSVLYPGVGHAYTPQMRKDMLAWFAHWLKPDVGNGRRAAKVSELGGPQGRTVRVAGIVLKWVRADKEANYRRAEPLIREAAAKGAKIVCTTECFLDGYAIADKGIPLEQYRALGEPIPAGPYFRRLAALAAELKIFLVAGVLEADGEARYNTAVLIGPDSKLVGRYRKQKLGHESPRNTAGSAAPTFESPHGRIGLMICADRTDPAIVRRLRANGADFLLCPSGGMFGPRNNDPIVQARSRENQLPIVFVHPAEFLVTGQDGSVLKRTLLGDALVIARDQVTGEKDLSQVLYFDLSVRRR